MEGRKIVNRLIDVSFTLTEREAQVLAAMVQNPLSEPEDHTTRALRKLIFETINGKAEPQVYES